MSFREAGRFENNGLILYDGGIVQYQLGAGTWTNLAYTTPAQAATTSSNFCSPILAGTSAWTGTTTGTTWTLTNAASVPTTNGQNIQFRWRLGGDVSGNAFNLWRLRRRRRDGHGPEGVPVRAPRGTRVCRPARSARRTPMGPPATT